jgi:hypothetical protein
MERNVQLAGLEWSAFELVASEDGDRLEHCELVDA